MKTSGKSRSVAAAKPTAISPTKSSAQAPTPVPVQKFVLEVGTIINLIKRNGEKIEKKIPTRIRNYKDLQREICVMTKNSPYLYTVTDEKNQPIYAAQFKTYDVIKVKEVAMIPDSVLLRKLPATWDRDDYGKSPLPDQVGTLTSNTSTSNNNKSKKKDDDDWD